MKKGFFSPLLICFCLFQHLLYAKTKEERVLEKLIQIESYLYQDPLEAKTALVGLLKENMDVPDSTQGLIYLKLGTVYGMTNNLDSGLWSIQRAMERLPKETLEHGAALKLLAILYRLKGDYQNAESAILRTLELNDSLWKDSFQKVLTLQEYAGLCLDRKDFFKGTTELLEAIKIASSPDFKDPKGSYTQIKLRVNLAEAYLQSHNYPFAIREFTICLPQLDSVKDNEGFLRSGISLSVAYMGAGRYNECDSLLTRLQSVANRIGNDELQSYLWNQQGVLSAERKDFKRALPFFRKAYGVMRKNNSSALISECVNKYLAALSNTVDNKEARQVINDATVKAAVERSLPADRLAFMRQSIRFTHDDLTSAETYAYLKELMTLSDTVNAEMQRNSAAELQAKYQFERQEESERLLMQENDLLKQKASFKRLQLYMVIAIAALAITILAMNVRRLRQRALLQSNKLKAKEQEILFQKDRSEWMEKEKSLRDQLINQQKLLLTQALADNEEMSRKMKELVMENQEQRRLELLEQLEKSKDKKLNIEVLLSHFNAVYPTFAGKLMRIYPKLTQADVQFCILFRMNLTTKEICILLNIGTRSIYVKKYRTMEKMGLGENDDFEKVLFAIE